MHKWIDVYPHKIIVPKHEYTFENHFILGYDNVDFNTEGDIFYTKYIRKGITKKNISECLISTLRKLEKYSIIWTGSIQNKFIIKTIKENNIDIKVIFIEVDNILLNQNFEPDITIKVSSKDLENLHNNFKNIKTENIYSSYLPVHLGLEKIIVDDKILEVIQFHSKGIDGNDTVRNYAIFEKSIDYRFFMHCIDKGLDIIPNIYKWSPELISSFFLDHNNDIDFNKHWQKIMNFENNLYSDNFRFKNWYTKNESESTIWTIPLFRLKNIIHNNTYDDCNSIYGDVF